jgi:hypothetical protein
VQDSEFFMAPKMTRLREAGIVLVAREERMEGDDI